MIIRVEIFKKLEETTDCKDYCHLSSPWSPASWRSEFCAELPLPGKKPAELGGKAKLRE